FSVISFLFIIISPCVANIASSEYVNEMRDNVQAKIDKKANNANYTQNMVLQTDNSGNVIATTVGTDLFADGAIETMHLADGAVTNADLAGMIDIKKLNLGTLPTSGKHMMIWNATTNEYVFERYATSILPTGYTRLEYIESTGTQYIDTGVSQQITRFEADIYKTSLELRQILFGLYSSDYKAGLYVLYTEQDSLQETMILTGEENVDMILDIPYELGLKHVLYSYIDGVAYCSVNGVSQTRKVTQVVHDFGLNYYLFADNKSGNAIYKYQGRLFSAKIWIGDMVRNFIPAKRNSDGVIGMYDTVTKTFFTNSGTGSFIAGPEVE
ncbi:MAG: hypothetical protein MJ170_04800, partial [Alphaproteobacteria bacterium]|nr:hypothetical protein [Alphaproteobacteria bacterium]